MLAASYVGGFAIWAQRGGRTNRSSQQLPRQRLWLTSAVRPHASGIRNLFKKMLHVLHIFEQIPAQESGSKLNAIVKCRSLSQEAGAAKIIREVAAMLKAATNNGDAGNPRSARATDGQR